jgi:hypothetical protein
LSYKTAITQKVLQGYSPADEKRGLAHALQDDAHGRECRRDVRIVY